jgi:ribosomal protein S25
VGSATARLLTDRYGIDQSHARKVLAAIAAQRGVSLHVLAAQLTRRIDRPHC